MEFEDDEDEMDFESRLASLDYEQNLTIQSDFGSKWRRNPVKKFSPSEDKIVFQQIEIDHYVTQVINTRVF